MTLYAVDRQHTIDGPTAANLGHFAQGSRVCWLTNNAMVNGLALIGNCLQHLLGAVDGRAFLVAGDQETDGTIEITVARRQELGCGIGEAGDCGFHVDRSPAIEGAVLHLRAERVSDPGVFVAHRHHVGVAGETEVWAAVAQPGIEVLHVRGAVIAEGDQLTVEADPFQRRLQDILRAAVGGRHAVTADHRPGKFDRIDSHGGGSRC